MRTGHWQHWLEKFWIATSLALSGVAVVTSGNIVLAQITPDGTLGAEGSVVIPNVNINGFPADNITGGATRGANLFHSFLEFNVGNGQRVYFANPTGIENILSRVTGTNPSEIFGTLGVNGGANLFLLNPHGIIFGEDASLDIGGSFTASTAESFAFPDGSEFSATNPQAAPLLKINVPIGLQYGPQQPGAIANRGNLAVGQDLTLSGGEVTSTGQLAAPVGEVVVEGVSGNVQVQYLEAQTATLSAQENLILEESQLWAKEDLTLLAEDTIRVRDSTANPFIAAAGGELLLQGNREVDIFALNHSDSGLFSFGDMVLRSANAIGGDAHYWSGSSFRIEQLDGSLGDLFSLYDPIIRSQGDVEFDGYQGTSLHILAGGQVEFNTAIITAPGAIADTINPTATPILANVTLSDGTPLVINGNAQPTLDVRAGMNPAAIGNPLGTIGVGFPDPVNQFFSTFFPTPLPPPDGNNPVATSADIMINDVRIEAPDGVVFLTNKYQPNLLLPGGDITLTRGNFIGLGIDASSTVGNGSSVIIDSRRDITLANGTSVISSGSNNAGDITFLAHNNITLTPGSTIQANGLLGNGGNINFNSNEGNITLDNSSISSSSDSNNAGDVNFIAQNNITLTSDSTIEANGLLGKGGNIAFDSDEGNISLDNSSLSSSSANDNAGDVNFIANRDITLTPGSTIEADSLLGKGGNIAFNSDEGNISLDNGSISSSSANDNAGDVTFLAQNNITFTSVSTIESVGLLGGNINLTSNDGIISLDDSDIESITTDSGIGGDINLSAESISLTNNAIALTSTVGPNGGRGGNLIADASDSVMLLNGGQFTSNTLGTGKAGDLTISTRQLIIQNSQPGSNRMTGAGSGTLEGSSGKGGNLTINASESVEIIGNEPGAFNPDLGQPGIVINVADISTGLTTATAGSGDAGNLTINTKQLMIRDGAGASSGNTDTSTGNGGRLIVNATQSLDLQGKAGLTTATLGPGNAGELVLTTGRMVLQDGALIGTDTLASGNAGDLMINTAELFLGNGSRIGAATTNEGSGATVTVNSSESVEVVGTSTDRSVPSGIFTNSEGSGNAGNLEIETRRLVVRDGGRISASTSGTGKAGNLLVNNSDSVEIIGTSADGKTASSLFFDSSGAGDAGELEIDTRRLVVRDGGRVSGSTSGTGRAGNLLVSNSDSVEIIGTSADGKTASSLFFDSSSSGNAGELIIGTSRLLVQDGGQVSAATSGEGKGGTLEVNASESVEVIGTSSNSQTPSRLFFDSSGRNSGDAGELIIDTNRFIVQDGGQVSAATSGDGRGGLLEVNASESVKVSGTSADNQFASGLFFDSRGTGDARGITINTGELTVQNGGQVTVSGSGTGISGDLEVTADSIFLTNQGSLGATTAAAEGGNIRLQVTDSIILRHNSEIVAQAFGTANGGNITIDAGGFVLAVLSENSDVVANAFEGRGGNIFAQAAGIFGFRQFQDRRTPESDFTASSELGIDGMVELIIEDNLTIIPLPDDFLRDSVVRGCSTMARELAPNEFIMTGSGGLPTHPAHLSSSNAIEVGLVQPAPPTQINSESAPSSATAQNATDAVPDRIVEAQNWVIHADGTVELVAYVPVATFVNFGLSASCNLQ